MKRLLIAAAGTVTLAVVLFLSLSVSKTPADRLPPASADGTAGRIADVAPAAAVPSDEDVTSSGPETGEETASPTDEERAEAEEEKLVDAFDALTDKWMEPAAKGVTLADVDAFVKQFVAVPKTRKEECLQRALNLIPDENVMLLAGVLMDKTQDKELVELVFNDILNRAEDVKKPIMLQVFKDKTHPCWADTAWILDVTGEIPKGP